MKKDMLRAGVVLALAFLSGVSLCYPREPTKEASGWTEWLNRDTPGGSGDFETLADFRKSGLACADPVDINCETLDGIDWSLADQEYSCSVETGGICRNQQQPGGRCLDYRVRFLCGKPLTANQRLFFEKRMKPLKRLGELTNRTVKKVGAQSEVASQTFLFSLGDAQTGKPTQAAATVTCTGTCAGGQLSSGFCAINGCKPQNGGCSPITCSIYCVASCSQTITVTPEVANAIRVAAESTVW